MIEFTIPLMPILIAAAIGGFIGGALIMILWMREATNFGRARHSLMVKEVMELRKRHNDWTDVPGDEVRTDRHYRWMKAILRRKGDIK